MEYLLSFFITAIEFGSWDDISSKSSHVLSNFELGLPWFYCIVQWLEHLFSAFYHVSSVALHTRNRKPKKIEQANNIIFWLLEKDVICVYQSWKWNKRNIIHQIILYIHVCKTYLPLACLPWMQGQQYVFDDTNHYRSPLTDLCR